MVSFASIWSENYCRSLKEAYEKKNDFYSYDEFMKNFRASIWAQNIKENIENNSYSTHDKKQMLSYAYSLGEAIFHYAMKNKVLDCDLIQRKLFEVEYFAISLSKATDVLFNAYSFKNEKPSRNLILRGWSHADLKSFLTMHISDARKELDEIASYREHRPYDLLNILLDYDYLNDPWFHNDLVDLLILDVFLFELCFASACLLISYKQKNSGGLKNFFRSSGSSKEYQQNLEKMYNLIGKTLMSYDELVDRPIDLQKLQNILRELSSKGCKINNACFAIIENILKRNGNRKYWYPDHKI